MNYATRTVGNGAFVKDLLASTRPEKVLDVVGYNNGAACFVQIHEAGAEPADGSVPLFSWPAQANLGWTFGQKVDLAAVYVCYSTTADTKTKVLANQGSITCILKG
ncbi:MAG: hypothetical protein KGL39_21310 [Patescibacteria group bacterium]|nr:hypothetical protein [Patescibacteria group bacterium]